MFLRSDGANSISVDNLTVIPTFTAVPEVSGAWIAAASAALLGARLCRRRPV
jgi:hypothetical protein